MVISSNVPKGTVYIGKSMGSFSPSSNVVLNDLAYSAKGVTGGAPQHAMANMMLQRAHPIFLREIMYMTMAYNII